MAKLGVLVHVYHLGTENWEEVTWGDAETGKLGSFPALAELLLHRMKRDEIVSIVLGNTNTQKDGFFHGDYTKKYGLDRFDRLADFPRLQGLLRDATDDELLRLRELLENIEVTRPIHGTLDEITVAAKIFSGKGVEEVIQVTAGNHAPRCAQLQLHARYEGIIPADQLWLVRPTDTCFGKNAKSLDTVIFEPPHRGDDPMLHFRPTLPEVLKQYHYSLSPTHKKELITQIDDFMQQHVTGGDARELRRA